MTFFVLFAMIYLVFSRKTKNMTEQSHQCNQDPYSGDTTATTAAIYEIINPNHGSDGVESDIEAKAITAAIAKKINPGDGTGVCGPSLGPDSGRIYSEINPSK